MTISRMPFDLKRWTKFLVPVAAAAALAGCGPLALQSARDAEPSGAAFSAALHGGYLELAEHENGEWDFGAAKLFAENAQAAAEGGDVSPLEVSADRLPAETVDELAGERDRLIAALDAGAAEAAPEDSARAQVMFDCWVHEQEENFQPDDIARCRDGFMEAIAAAEAAIPAPVEEEPVAEAIPLTFFVFFDFDSDQLTAEGNQAIATAVQQIDTQAYSVVQITGYADRSGSDDYNMDLSKRRAETAASALALFGVSETAMSVQWRGEEDPLLPTEDGVREPQNRRVEIDLLP